MRSRRNAPSDCAGDPGDQHAEDLGAHVVQPSLARLMGEREAAQALHELVSCAGERPFAEGQPCLGQRLLEGTSRREEAHLTVARSKCEEVAQRDRALGGHRVVERAVDRPQDPAVLSSGSQSSTGSSSRILHSSTRIMAPTAVIGFVMEARRKIVSRPIGTLLSNTMVPIASTCSRPRWWTSATRPGTWPLSTWRCRVACIRASRAREKPFCRSWTGDWMSSDGSGDQGRLRAWCDPLGAERAEELRGLWDNAGGVAKGM